MRWPEYLVFVALVVLLAKPAGLYLQRVFERKQTFLDPLLSPLERLFYRLLGVDPANEMTSGTYTICFILFSAASAGLVLLLLLTQHFLPGGPDDHYLSTPLTWHLAANTAVSFSTATTWQAYGGETTLRYLTVLIGLVSQNFLAGASGLALGMAFMRGFARERCATLGNFWADLIRGILWVLLPLSLVGSLVLVWQGVPFNLSPYTQAHTLEGGLQIIAQGPVAALEFIKNLGSNGGGFFNANGAHPFENPTPLVNFLLLLAISVLPASLTMTFGSMIHRPKVGWLLLGLMVGLLVMGLGVCDYAESSVPAKLADLHITGGNMEGKEVRFGIGGSALAAVVTANGATGSYNSMMGSYQPLGALVPLVNMLLGEVIFGGLGTGLFSMIMIVLVAVFLGGLMVGRTPEYLGKRIMAGETKLIVLYSVVTPAFVLLLSALAIVTHAGQAGLVTNSGPRGLTEILFAYASCVANNGQVMAGLSVNSLFYNLTTILAMLAGRYGLGALAIALAGRLAAQRHWPTTAGTLPSDSFSFGVLVFGTIVLVGALCFLPALALGPVAEALSH